VTENSFDVIIGKDCAIRGKEGLLFRIFGVKGESGVWRIGTRLLFGNSSACTTRQDGYHGKCKEEIFGFHFSAPFSAWILVFDAKRNTLLYWTMAPVPFGEDAGKDLLMSINFGRSGGRFIALIAFIEFVIQRRKTQ
jgi:hypothetical protein